MISKIGAHDLKIGMYVCDLDRPWRETPFLFQGFEIRTEDEIRKLQQYCRHVFVNERPDPTTPGANVLREWRNPVSPAARRMADVQYEQELLKLNNHPAARPVYEDTTSLEEEILLARPSYDAAIGQVADLMRDARMGRVFAGSGVRRTVKRMADSVLRNPDALTCYAQLKRKDDYLAQHGLRSCILALIYGRHLGLERDDIESLGVAGLLHDIGMVKVPDDVLLKADKLNPTEQAVMRRHVVLGAEMLERSSGIPYPAIQATREHHERYDGAGYLAGLAGEEISEAGRIIAIVDYYDATTSNRPHQPAMSPYAALRLMYGERGTVFDPVLVERFIQCLGIYPIGSVVRLNTGEVGVVVALNRQARLKPHVALVRQADDSLYPVPPMVNLHSRRLGDGSPCEIERVLDPQAARIDPVQYLPASLAP